MSHLEYEPSWRRLFVAIMRKDDVINETESTKRIATPPEKDRATAIDGRQNYFGEV